MRSLLARALRRAGFVVEAHATGDGALLALARRDTDVVLTDYQLPGVNGGAIGAEARRQGVPAVLVSATLDAIDDAERACFLRVLAKPFPLSELEEALEALKTAALRKRSGVRPATVVVAPPGATKKTSDGKG